LLNPISNRQSTPRWTDGARATAACIVGGHDWARSRARGGWAGPGTGRDLSGVSVTWHWDGCMHAMRGRGRDALHLPLHFLPLFGHAYVLCIVCARISARRLVLGHLSCTHDILVLQYRTETSSTGGNKLLRVVWIRGNSQRNSKGIYSCVLVFSSLAAWIGGWTISFPKEW
jgi:hypothetical protein